MKKPLLSICLRTYNNEAFVLEAVNGMLNQNVNFDLEFVYSDDCSADDSFKVVKNAIDGSNKFVNIHLAKQEKNLGMIDNLLYLLKNCNGDYIAMCDGDDYWSDPNKLQLQVDFLEANLDYEVCFTNVCTINEEGEVLKQKLIKDNRRTDYEMQHLPTWIPVSTKVYRNRDFSGLSRTVPGDDVYMVLYQSKFGKLKFLNVVTGAYRYQSKSEYSSKDEVFQKDYILKTHMECMDLVTTDLYPKYQRLILKKIVELRHLDSNLFKKRLVDFKVFRKTYPNRFSTSESIKIKMIVAILRVFDLCNINSGKVLILRLIDRTI